MDRADRLAYVPMASPLVAELLPGMTEDDLTAHWHLITTDGEDLTGGRAGVALLEQLTPTRYLGVLLRALRLHWAVGIVDSVLKKVRGRLGRLVAEGPGPERYP